MGCVLASFIAFGLRETSVEFFEELEERRRNAGDLHRAVAAEGAWSPQEAGPLASPDRKLRFGAAVQTNDVVGTDTEQLAKCHCRCAQLDGDRESRLANAVGESEPVVFGAALSARSREPCLGVEAIHQWLDHGVGHTDRDRAGHPERVNLE